MDGLGNLSEQALIAWADYVLDTCLGPIRFMADLLDSEAIKTRIEAIVRKQCVRQEAPQHALRFKFPQLWPEADSANF